MKQLFILIFHFLRTGLILLKPSGAKILMAENILLRKQLIIMGRNRKRAPNLSRWDRLSFAFLAANLSPKKLAKMAIIVKPSMLIKFHKALIKRKYRLLFSNTSRRKPGPPGPSQAFINAIVEMKKRNPRFGCRRIAMQISNQFAVNINKDVVWRILAKYCKPTSDNNGPSWLTFLGDAKDSLWSIDFFRCESVSLKSHWVMIVMDQYTRRIIGFAVHPGDLNGIAICTMFNKIISKKQRPRYLSSDNDPLFQYHRWHANLRILEIEEIKSLPYIPMSHPFVERLIKIVRNELLDRSLFWTDSDLQSKLDKFQQYFNEHRAHMGLDGQIPSQISNNKKSKPIDINHFRWKSHCKGLFQLPIAA